MRVLITGGTGLIGSSLVQRLVARGDRPVVLTRNASKAKLKPAFDKVEVVQGDPMTAGGWQVAVDGCDSVVNLVGHNIFAERWTEETKRKIRDSRVQSTENVVAAIAKANQKPKVLVQGSAVGYYGPRGDEELNESSPSGSDFMAVVCREWEETAHPVEELGVRLATVRTGIVLAKGEGALGAMTPIFKWVPLGAAPVGSGDNPFKPASGRQWFSWIHLDDIVGIVLLALDNDAARGPLNGTAPNPVRNAEFSKELAKVLWSPLGFWRFYVPIGPPDAMLNLVLGEVAQVVSKGQKALPAKALELGYIFRFPEVATALRNIFKGEQSPISKPEPVGA